MAGVARFVRGLGGALLVGLTLHAGGCNQLMGIEEASVDPTLTQSEVTRGSGGTVAQENDSADAANAATTGDGSGGGSTTTGADPLGESGASGQDPDGASGGTTSATSTTAGSEPSGTTGGGQETSLCDSYCDEIMEVCTGAQLQYRDRAQCSAICATFPEGKLGQTNVNSVACRAKYVGDARYGSGTELVAYCRQAGPGGSDRCGSNCQGFCAIMMNVCTPQDASVYHYDTEQDCLDACEALPELSGGYSASDPTIADGNHVQCRLFHVMSAAMLDPEEHCEHAMGVTLCEQLADP